MRFSISRRAVLVCAAVAVALALAMVGVVVMNWPLLGAYALGLAVAYVVFRLTQP